MQSMDAGVEEMEMRLLAREHFAFEHFLNSDTDNVMSTAPIPGSSKEMGGKCITTQTRQAARQDVQDVQRIARQTWDDFMNRVQQASDNTLRSLQSQGESQPQLQQDRCDTIDNEDTMLSLTVQDQSRQQPQPIHYDTTDSEMDEITICYTDANTSIELDNYMRGDLSLINTVHAARLLDG